MSSKNKIRIIIVSVVLISTFGMKVILSFYPEWIITGCETREHYKVCGATDLQRHALTALDQKLVKIKEIETSGSDAVSLYFVPPGFKAFILGVGPRSTIVHSSATHSVFVYSQIFADPALSQSQKIRDMSYQLTQAQIASYLGPGTYASVPVWILSGLGRWVADDQFNYTETLTWIKMADPKITQSKDGDQLKSQLIVTYLLERQGETIDSVLKIKDNPKVIMSEMF